MNSLLSPAVIAPAASHPPEPRPENFRNAWSKIFFATRPAFLSVTAGGWLLGMTSALLSGLPVNPVTAGVALILGLLAHAGINVINDYYDAIDGSDAENRERVFPFTGGSRFIQNGVLSLRDAAWLGYGLLALVIPGGLWLARQAGDALLVIGMAGLLVGWAYSARPLSLMRSGWGEPCVAAGFLLIVMGTDCVQRGSLSSAPVWLGLTYALLVMNILYLNQFPDYASDAVAGKRNWVVRLGRRRARWLYLLVALWAHGWWAGLQALGLVPGIFAVTLLAAPVSAYAAIQVLLHAEQPQRLAPAIRATIAAALLHSALAMLAWLAHHWSRT